MYPVHVYPGATGWLLECFFFAVLSDVRCQAAAHLQRFFRLRIVRISQRPRIHFQKANVELVHNNRQWLSQSSCRSHRRSWLASL